MKIGILYICTGEYKIFWKDFYLSCEKNFIPGIEKHYFVFTDTEVIEFEKENLKIHRVFQKNLGWPGNTLERYRIFLKIKDRLKNFDYLFFFNANLQFLKVINSEDFLPNSKESLVACLHPGFFNKKREKFTYEKNKESSAFIAKKQGEFYFAGGINGGKSQNFILAMEEMAKNIELDKENDCLAVWHDESHWNRYLINRNDIKILSPSYLYPEGANIPFEAKVIIKDKNKAGGHIKLRGKIEFKLVVNKIKKILFKAMNKIKFKKVVKIKGGLGNQLFQYAYARHLELLGKKVVFNSSFFKGGRSANEVARDFKLDKFNIKTKIKFSDKKYLFNEFCSKLKAIFGLNVEEYFQSENYFLPIEDFIVQEFNLKGSLEAELEDKVIYKNILENKGKSVSLHVRRGDYVTDKKTNDFHGTCDLDYYGRAIDKIRQEIGDPVFFIFSDDIDWVKENLKSKSKTYYVEGLQDYEDLVSMSKCSHNIIANSTFSWWGAWLNRNPDKVVIAPKRWFNNLKMKENGIVPVSWIRL